MGLGAIARTSGSVSALQDVLATYRKALAVLESNGPHTGETWQARKSANCFYIAYALRDLGARTGEIGYYRQALESALKGDAINRLLVAADPKQTNRRSVADGLTEIAFLRWKCCSDLDGALRDIHDAVAAFRAIAGQDQENMEARRDLANAYKNLGVILGEAGRRAEALDANRKALAIYQLVSRADPNSQEDAAYIAEVQSRIGALARAR
jgi:tetratricopeptide (TPR) repeat protein